MNIYYLFLKWHLLNIKNYALNAKNFISLITPLHPGRDIAHPVGYLQGNVKQLMI